MKWLTWFWAQLTRTDHAGFVNAGDDFRVNPFGIPGWIQGHLSFKSEREYWVHVQFGFFGAIVFLGFPPFFVLNIPLPHGRYKILRIGFRYDKNWKGYIFPEAVIKTLPYTQIY